MKDWGPNLKDVRLSLNKNWIPSGSEKLIDFRPTDQNAELLRLIRSAKFQSFPRYLGVRLHRLTPETEAG